VRIIVIRLVCVGCHVGIIIIELVCVGCHAGQVKYFQICYKSIRHNCFLKIIFLTFSQNLIMYAQSNPINAII